MRPISITFWLERDGDTPGRALDDVWESINVPAKGDMVSLERLGDMVVTEREWWNAYAVALTVAARG